MIRTENLCKNFGRCDALNDVTITIKKGEIVGFLGQNGAGKTTLMRILTSFLMPSSGRAFIDGEDVCLHSLSVRRKIGYLPETPPLYENMTVQDYLKFAARLKDVEGRDVKREVERVFVQCDLSGVKHKTISVLSKGFKQRVGIAQAIIHNPAVLILDEPTSGLDPLQNLSVRDLIKSQEGERTIILSTHVLSEIEEMAERVLIIKEGTIIADHGLKELCDKEGTLEKAFLRINGMDVDKERVE
ncbi:ABC transporter ATP-binding protein [Candidatus Omnitrophota bacterium]